MDRVELEILRLFNSYSFINTLIIRNDSIGSISGIGDCIQNIIVNPLPPRHQTSIFEKMVKFSGALKIISFGHTSKS